MKTLFNERLELNSDGIELSTRIKKLLKSFQTNNNLVDLNPIEVEWIMNSEITIENSNFYIDCVMSTLKS